MYCGDTFNDGEITMTKKGAKVEEGQNVYLWENIDNTYEFVPKDGARGLEEYIPGRSRIGVDGNIGKERATRAEVVKVQL